LKVSIIFKNPKINHDGKIFADWTSCKEALETLHPSCEEEKNLEIHVTLRLKRLMESDTN
jgi:hypothetical protein